MTTVHLLIKGKVQGVFFRATAKEVADKLGVKGWIKNTWDDDVEAMATGSEEAIQKFIEWDEGNGFGGFSMPSNFTPVSGLDSGGGARMFIQTGSKMNDLPQDDEDTPF